MRILYCDPSVNSPTSRNYKYYDGVVEQLMKIEGCEVYLHQGIPHRLSDSNIEFNFVVFGLGWFNHGFFGEIPELNIPSVCILFKPQNDLQKKLDFCKINKVSRILTPVPRTSEYESMTGIKTILFPYGHCPNTFHPRPNIEKRIDVGFSGALHENKHYPDGSFPVKNIRTKIGEKLASISNIEVYWNSSDDRPSRIPSYEEYAEKICSSKMWIATQAAFGDVTPRYYEILSSGTLLLCQSIPEEYKHIFVNEVNCVEFENDLSDFSEKVELYSRDEVLRNKITSKAVIDASSHTWKNRAEELVRILGEI